MRTTPPNSLDSHGGVRWCLHDQAALDDNTIHATISKLNMGRPASKQDAQSGQNNLPRSASKPQMMRVRRYSGKVSFSCAWRKGTNFAVQSFGRVPSRVPCMWHGNCGMENVEPMPCEEARQKGEEGLLVFVHVRPRYIHRSHVRKNNESKISYHHQQVCLHDTINGANLFSVATYQQYA